MSDALKKLKTPAIGMIVIAVLNLLLIAVIIISGLFSATPRIADDTIKTAYYIGVGLRYAFGAVSIFFGPLIIYGSLKMMKGQSYGWAKIAAILSILPLTCLAVPLGMIFGIWAFVVLANPEVKGYFAGDNSQTDPQEPPPQT